MLRLFNNMPLDKYQTLRLNNKSYYKKLVYSLCWFHSVRKEINMINCYFKTNPCFF